MSDHDWPDPNEVREAHRLGMTWAEWDALLKRGMVVPPRKRKDHPLVEELLRLWS
jgi:hypothetical protein